MKCITHVILILLCAGAVSCVSNSGPVTGAWSGATNGLQAALRVPSARVKAGTEVPIVAVFRNPGRAPRKLPISPYYAISVSHHGRGFADSIGTAKISEAEPELQPGEERAFRLTGLRTDINGSGVYSLGGALGGMQLDRIEVLAK